MDGSTQNDPTAMAIYAIAIIPLILMLVAETNQVDNITTAYADDLTVTETIIRLRNWWEKLCRLGPKSGYFPEGSKSCLIVEEKMVQKAQSVHED